jgi:hypothetical protein
MPNDITKSQQDTGGKGTFLLERRGFLRLSSVAMFGIATTGLADTAVQGVKSVFLPEKLPLMSIGYAKTFDGANERMIPAERISSGDHAFADGGVRLRIAGFWRAPQHRGTPLSIAVNVHYPDAPFIAWSSASRGSALTSGSPIGATIPIDTTHALQISIDSLTARPSMVRSITRRVLNSGDDQPRVEQSIATIGFGSSDAPAKLRRGVYVLAIRESDRDVTPDWSSIRWSSAESGMTANGDGPLRVASVIGSNPAPFSYVVLTTDYARA